MIKIGMIFMLCAGRLSHASVDLSDSFDLNKFRERIIEEVKTQVSGVIELNEEVIREIVSETKKRTSSQETLENRSEQAEFQKKAEEYEAAGDAIQADLYRAKASMVEAENYLSGKRQALDVMVHLAVAVQELTDQGQQFPDKINRYRGEKLRLPHYRAEARLYEAQSAQFAASGKQGAADKHRRAAEQMTEAAELQTTANEYLNTGNKLQADVYTAKARLVREEALSHIEERSQRMRAALLYHLYSAEAAWHKAAGQHFNRIAEKYQEAADLAMNANLMRKDAQQTQLTHNAEAAAKAAENIKLQCAYKFGVVAQTD